jgi:hypothetical protein
LGENGSPAAAIPSAARWNQKPFSWIILPNATYVNMVARKIFFHSIGEARPKMGPAFRPL